MVQKFNGIKKKQKKKHLKSFSRNKQKQPSCFVYKKKLKIVYFLSFFINTRLLINNVGAENTL